MSETRENFSHLEYGFRKGEKMMIRYNNEWRMGSIVDGKRGKVMDNGNRDIIYTFEIIVHGKKVQIEKDIQTLQNEVDQYATEFAAVNPDAGAVFKRADTIRFRDEAKHEYTGIITNIDATDILNIKYTVRDHEGRERVIEEHSISELLNNEN